MDGWMDGWIGRWVDGRYIMVEHRSCSPMTKFVTVQFRYSNDGFSKGTKERERDGESLQDWIRLLIMQRSLVTK